MIKHSSPISGVSTLTDQYVLTAGYDNRLILWDAQTRRSRACGTHDHLVNQCAFSPCGQYAASASSDYSVRLWTLPDLRLFQVLLGHEDDVEAVVFHPAKKLLATCSRDQTIGVFDYSGRLLRRLYGHQADVISVAWQADSDNIISSSDDGTVKRWDATTGALLEDIDLGGIETDTLVISRDGRIYAGNDSGEIIMIAGSERFVVAAHQAGIKRLIYDEQQALLVSLSYDRSLKIWNCCKNPIQCVHMTTFPAIVWPRSGAFLNADTLIFATFGSTYAEYQIKSQLWLADQIEDTAGINAACEVDGYIYSIGDAGILYRDGIKQRKLPSLCNFLIAYGGTLITGGQTGQIFNAQSGECYYQHRSPLNCATVFTNFTNQSHEKIMIGSYTGEGIVLQLMLDGKIAYERTVPLHKNAIKGLASSQQTLFSVCADTAAAFHHVDTFECVAYVAHAHHKIANGCAGANSGRFVSVSRDLKLRIWDAKASPLLQPVIVCTPSKHSIKCVAISGDGETVAIGTYSGHVGVYQITSETWIYWDHPSASGISSIHFCDDGRLLFSAYDGTVQSVKFGDDVSQGLTLTSHKHTPSVSLEGSVV